MEGEKSVKEFDFPNWQLVKLGWLHAIALALLASYLVPSGLSLWRQADEAVFFFLNGTLDGPGPWASFWAWTNTRYCDAIVGLFIFLCLIYPFGGFSKDRLQTALFSFVAMLLVLLAARTLFHQFCAWAGLAGMGPSLVLSPVVMLSDLYPNIPLKDASHDSFPGDHATVLLAWTGFVLMFQSVTWRSFFAAGLPLIMVLPRMIAGAHWFSDVAVGGLVVALPVLGWTFYSPVVSRLANGMAWALDPLLKAMAGWPWFRSQHFFLHGPMTARLMGAVDRETPQQVSIIEK